MVYLTAAAGERHAHARPDAAAQPLVGELFMQHGCHIVNAVPHKLLTNQRHAGDGRVLQYGAEPGLFFDFHIVQILSARPLFFCARISARRSD